MSGCIIAKGAPDTDGYKRGWVPIGAFTLKSPRAGYALKAHVAAYLVEHGADSVPQGMLVCHHCDNPPCVNPDHLFLGTHTDNHRDRDQKKRGPNSRKTHCPQGHEYTEENTYRYKGTRQCQICRREATRAHNEGR